MQVEHSAFFARIQRISFCLQPLALDWRGRIAILQMALLLVDALLHDVPLTHLLPIPANASLIFFRQ